MNRELAEQLLQRLSSMLIQLNALQSQFDRQQQPASKSDQHVLQTGLQTLEQMAREMLAFVRVATDEQPLPELEGTTLAEALSHLIEETAEQWGISSRISLTGIDAQEQPQYQALPASVDRLLYVIASEALLQVQQRTDTHRLRLSLHYASDNVQMSIEDDGKNQTSAQFAEESEESEGTPAPPFMEQGTASGTAPAFSIFTDLRYRVAQLGGSLDVSPLEEHGTRVLVRIPYQPEIAEHETNIDPLETEVKLEEEEKEHIRLLLVDSQAVTRAGLRSLLESYPGLQVIGEAVDSVQAVSETLELGPDVVLMEAMLPNGQSLEALRQIKQLNLETRVLLLSSQEREEYLYETLRAGADGYVLKDIAPDELAQAIRAVARGDVLVQPQLAGRLLSRVGRRGRNGMRSDALTARELDVLRLLARGLRNKEIAARLYVSERTVNFHLANIYQKLSVSGRTEALSKAIEQGLIMA